MLSQSLKDLESEWLVNRTQFNEIPPRVEYELTEKRRSILPVLTSAYEWALIELKNKNLSPSCKNCG